MKKDEKMEQINHHFKEMAYHHQELVKLIYEIKDTLPEEQRKRLEALLTNNFVNTH